MKDADRLSIFRRIPELLKRNLSRKWMVGRGQKNLFFISFKYQQHFAFCEEEAHPLRASQEKCIALISYVIGFMEVGRFLLFLFPYFCALSHSPQEDWGMLSAMRACSTAGEKEGMRKCGGGASEGLRCSHRKVRLEACNGPLSIPAAKAKRGCG